MRVCAERLLGWKADFERRGFVVIDELFSEAELEALREECDDVISLARTQLQADCCSYSSAANGGEGMGDLEVIRQNGCIFEVLQARHGSGAREIRSGADFKRLRSARPLSTLVSNLITSKSFVDLIRALLGGERDDSSAYYFNEQYIVKPPMTCASSAFKWHRDSDWCIGDSTVQYHQYLSLWTPLDDVDEENGTLYILEEEETPIIANAGDCIVMSDRFLHRSGGNVSDKVRRVWMPQFSRGPICRKTTGGPVSFAVRLSEP